MQFLSIKNIFNESRSSILNNNLNFFFILFISRIGRVIKQSRAQRKTMMRAGISQYKSKNCTKHELSATDVIEMNILEAPCRTPQEELLANVQSILLTHPSNIEFDRGITTPTKIRNRNDSVYISRKTRR